MKSTKRKKIPRSPRSTLHARFCTANCCTSRMPWFLRRVRRCERLAATVPGISALITLIPFRPLRPVRATHPASHRKRKDKREGCCFFLCVCVCFSVCWRLPSAEVDVTERWRPAGAERWLRLPVVLGWSSVVRTAVCGGGGCQLAGRVGGARGTPLKSLSSSLHVFLFVFFLIVSRVSLRGWGHNFLASHFDDSKSKKGNGILCVWHLG